MQINYGDSSMELTPDNTYIVQYPNDMLDGIIIDLDDKYAFISAHSEGYAGLLDEVDELGVGWFSIDEFDPTEAPHSWVIQSISSLIVRTCEDTIDES